MPSFSGGMAYDAASHAIYITGATYATYGTLSGGGQNKNKKSKDQPTMEYPSFRQLVESASDMYDDVIFKTNDLYNEPAPEPVVRPSPFIFGKPNGSQVSYLRRDSLYVC